MNNNRARFHGMVCVAFWAALTSSIARADDPVLESARRALAAGNARQAYAELIAVQDKMTGTPEYDYLLGVAALESGKVEDAIIAFERVLALIPNHAGAQMDLARAYYATGSFDLAEAAFLKLQASNPPPAAQQAIQRYLEALQTRRKQLQAGWTGFGELGWGYDSNITAATADFGAAVAHDYGFAGFVGTGNAVKRSAWFGQADVGLDYSRPLTRGWSWFAGGEQKARAYRHEPHYNFNYGELHTGAALNSGQSQWRISGTLSYFEQQGEIPTLPGSSPLDNDRRMGGVGVEWRHALDTRNQVGAALQWNRTRFPRNGVEDFSQVFASVSWLKSFEGRGVPLLYVTGFVTDDHAKNSFAVSPTETATKSKNLVGARAYLQYSINPKLLAFANLGETYRRDKDSFARATNVEKGKDWYSEAGVGLAWQFREACALRVQYQYSRNDTDVKTYAFNRHEATTAVRCDI
jgi:tetratricopeptide (TPR) repeat protein